MNVQVPAEKYVVAVSGGVDSVVLLDVLARQPNLELVVAHFDHGIRSDSADDARFVADVAQQHGLPYITERIELGAGASEDKARQARYDFLRRTMREQQAAAIITAHHQDDVLETAVFNLLRGTGRKGLTSLADTDDIKRPFLDTPKKEILEYARAHHLAWREDSTNSDTAYTRNYIRHTILPRLTPEQRRDFLIIISKQRVVNAELDKLLQLDTAELDRRWFTRLPHREAREVMASWLRVNNLANFDKPTIERLTVQAKTKSIGKKLDVQQGAYITVEAKRLVLHKK